jgi:dihydrofolate reductase
MSQKVGIAADGSLSVHTDQSSSVHRKSPVDKRIVRKPAISLVAAMSDNWIIGFSKRLPWHLPEDLRHFRELTIDHTIIMGRKTFESIGRALPRRRNIVVSRATSSTPPRVEPALSLADALQKCRGEDRVYVIGGGEIFREALPIADQIHLTLVYLDAPQESLFGPILGDAFFPNISPREWRIYRLGRRRAAILGNRHGSSQNLKGVYYRFIDLKRVLSPRARDRTVASEVFHWSHFPRSRDSGKNKKPTTSVATALTRKRAPRAAGSR